ncbi:hypothetical protein K1719_037510 [Acacia pycnantha]|nr:hypothetical protein K1719_037510 [Acacia pycnantha]
MSPLPSALHSSHGLLGSQQSQYETMVMDVVGPSFRDNYNEDVEEMPNSNARAFYELLLAEQQPLWEGCKDEYKPSAALKLLSFKETTNMSQ